MIYLNPGDNLDTILKRFKKIVQKSGILREARMHEEFIKPSERKRLKSAKARQRLNKSR